MFFDVHFLPLKKLWFQTMTFVGNIKVYKRGEIQKKRVWENFNWEKLLYRKLLKQFIQKKISIFFHIFKKKLYYIRPHTEFVNVISLCELVKNIRNVGKPNL